MAITQYTSTQERVIPLPEGVGGAYELFTPDYVDNNIGGLTCREQVINIFLDLLSSTIKVKVEKRITKLDGGYLYEDKTYVLKDKEGLEEVSITSDYDDVTGEFSNHQAPVVTELVPISTPVQEWIDSAIWPAITSSTIARIIANR